jgi:hypothetical protein
MNNSQPDWAVPAGARGWKLTARQYAQTLAGVISGTTMPADYWKLMISFTEAAPSGYGMAIYKVWSAHSGIGPYYSHNGGDGNDLGSGGGAWLEWDNKVIVYLRNSSCEGDRPRRRDRQRIGGGGGLTGAWPQCPTPNVRAPACPTEAQTRAAIS